MKMPQLDVRVYRMPANGDDPVEVEVESIDLEDNTIWVYLKEKS